MEGYPPVILVETWLYLATNRNPELEHIKLPIHREIKYFFGSIELAQLYIEQEKSNVLNVYYV